MTRERFVMLSDKDKEKILIKTMEFMVEMEGRYHQHVSQNGYSFERYQKYVEHLRKIQNIFFQEAIADNTPDTKFETIANDFKAHLAKLGSSSCIYGGWISKIKKTDLGSSVCPHPLFSGDKDIIAAYKASSSNCVGTQVISCNPMVFGYQATDKQRPFCVKTGLIPGGNRAHNVSYECMRKALSPEPESGPASKTERLNYLKNQMSQESMDSAFNSVHNYIIRTCACGDPKYDMDEDYRNYIRPHRTCFGMLNTLRSFDAKECSALTSSLSSMENSQSFMEEWNGFFNDMNIKELEVPGTRAPLQFDLDYSKLVMDERVQKYCSGEEPAPKEVSKWICEAKCEPQEAAEGEGKSWNCTVTKAGMSVVGKDGETTATEMKEEEVIKVTDPLQTEITVHTKSGEEKTCPIQISQEEKKNACSIALTISEDKKTLSATVTPSLIDDQLSVEKIDWIPALEASEEEANKAISDSIDIPWDGKEMSVSVKMILSNKEEITCEASQAADPDADDGKKYELTTKGETETATHKTIKAIVTTINGEEKKEGLPAGFKIVWTRKGSEGLELTDHTKKPKKEEKESDSKIQDDTPKPEEPKEEPKPEVKIEGQVHTGESITEARSTKSYEACADLYDDKGTKVAGPSCQPIPPISAPVVTPNGGMPPQMPRIQRNMSAGGIL